MVLIRITVIGHKKAVINAEITELSEENRYPGSLLLLNGYVVLKRGKTVEYKCSYKDGVLMADSSDPRKLMLVLEGTALSVLFSDVKTLLEFKSHYEEMKKTLLKYQLSLIVKQVESALVLCQ